MKRIKKNKKKANKSKKAAEFQESSDAGTSSKLYTDSSDVQVKNTNDETINKRCMEIANSYKKKMEKECWTKTTVEEKSREEEFDDYLVDLLL